MRERGDTGVLAFKWMLPGEESHCESCVCAAIVVSMGCGLWIWMAGCALLTIDVGGGWRTWPGKSCEKSSRRDV